MKVYDLMKMLDLSGRIEMNVPMKSLTTMRVGGPADCVVFAASISDVERVALFCQDRGVPLTVVGRGSNLVVRDGGIRGVVLALGKGFARITVEGKRITAQAGATLGALSRAAQEAGLTGLEFAEGIPGSVGGGVYMNAGAYGGEMSQVTSCVSALSHGGEIVQLNREQMELSYRHSALMDKKMLALEASFDLQLGDRERIAARMAECSLSRRTKQPLQYASSGSFFKRPQGYFAGKLIEESGLKGASVGGAQISRLHAGFLINTGDATARDILDLMAKVQQTVRDQYGVNLEPEVRIIGEESDKSVDKRV